MVFAEFHVNKKKGAFLWTNCRRERVKQSKQIDQKKRSVCSSKTK